MNKPIHGLARSTDPQTSHDAAASVDITALIDKIYAVMSDFPDGCIMDDVLNALPDINIVSISPSFARMVEMGMIEATDETREGYRSGRCQMVRKVLLPPFVPVPPKRQELVELRSRVKQLELENAKLKKYFGYLI